jgi:SAM-dependent methyltransferase
MSSPQPILLDERTAFLCGICGAGQATGNYEAREMMFGLRTPFHYAQCAECGSLWLTDPPSDFGAFYPRQYYSFANRVGGTKERLKEYLQAKRDRTYFGDASILGRFLAGRYEDCAVLSVSKLGIGRNARILDVGCGNGKLLHQLAAIGFENLSGVDPFLSHEIRNGERLRIRNCLLEDLAGEKFDLVMFHHSLEHIANPKGTLRIAARLLGPGGTCLVRLPVVAHAWEQYGTNWVQLDPPRHMWVPSEKAVRMLAELSGLRVERVEYDSTEFQFWGSELYARGVPLGEVAPQNLTGFFRKSEIAEFRERAAKLNRDGRGDEAIFVLSAEVGRQNS